MVERGVLGFPKHNLAPSQNTLVGTTAFQLSTSKVADLNSLIAAKPRSPLHKGLRWRTMFSMMPDTLMRLLRGCGRHDQDGLVHRNWRRLACGRQSFELEEGLLILLQCRLAPLATDALLRIRGDRASFVDVLHRRLLQPHSLSQLLNQVLHLFKERITMFLGIVLP